MNIEVLLQLLKVMVDLKSDEVNKSVVGKLQAAGIVFKNPW